ncbi:iron-siderophore ABC transporter substrate-binding protein [Methylopila turkensis]|uniref:ABC transporter substrate-binding protein n=1 Tax=Methylopila turkensis TaxID=1437816 RepID=A0A9W6JQ40_9HYPH|nr:iron-siderophore ABC transporter substrate-binding protein [Methylopila turkensis]GLK79583.1 ABC transporter substrate-binding protein [Methylopila turkensis]
MLVGAAALMAASGASKAAPARRVVTLDYGVGQTLIEIGRPPIAMAAIDEWDRWCVEPRLTPGIVNLGTSREPNLELLQQLAPDLILSTPYLERLKPKLARIAPVETLPVHATGSSPWPNLVAAARRIGDLIGARDEAEAFLARVDAELAEARERVRPLADRPLLMVNFQDARNVWVFGRNSLYQDGLVRLGLTNGWTRPTNAWGFAAVGVEALAEVHDARLALFDPTPSDALALLRAGPIWKAVGFAEPGRTIRLAPALAFGGLPVLTRLARLLGEAAARV